MRINHTFFMLALSKTQFLYVSPAKAQTEWVNVNGIATYNGEPVCAIALVNGQYMFTCSGDGSFNLDVPLDEQSRIVVYWSFSGWDSWNLDPPRTNASRDFQSLNESFPT